jgi:hypothetical protein
MFKPLLIFSYNSRLLRKTSLICSFRSEDLNSQSLFEKIYFCEVVIKLLDLGDILLIIAFLRICIII